MKKDGEGAAIRAIMLGLILLAFGIRIYHLDFQSLWRDEVDAILFAQQSLPTLAANFVRVGQNGPLYFLILHYWIRLAGISEFAVRFLSLAFGVLIIPTVYLLGRRLFGAGNGLLAAFLTALSPYHVWYSQEAKMYSLVALLALLSLYLFHLALRKNQWFLWLGCILVTGLSMYIHLFALLIIPVEALWLALLWRRHRRVARNALVVLACLALPYLPIAVWQVPALLSPPAETGYYPYGLREMMGILFSSFSLGVRPAEGPLPIAPFAFLFLAGMLYEWNLRPEGARGSVSKKWRVLSPNGGVILLLAYILIPIIAVYMVSLGRPTFTDRYLIFILPGYYLMCACGLLAVKRKSPLLFALCLSLVVLLSIRGVWVQDHVKIKADFRAAAQFFASRARAEDLVVFVMPYVRHAFSYYYPGEFNWAEPPYTNRGMGQEEVAAAMEEATRGYDRVWLLLSEADFWDSPGLIEGWFRQSARLVDEGRFQYIELCCYEMGRDGLCSPL